MKIELETDDIDRLATEIMLKLTDSLKSGIVPPAPAEDAIFTVETLAAYLVTTPKWVYNHLSDLPHFKVDGLLRFRKKVIDSFFEQNPSKRPVPR
jgi:hypothetical protein